MHLVFVGVIARRLELEDAAVVVEDVGRGQRDLAHRGARRRQHRGGPLEQRMGIAGRRAPRPGCGKSRSAGAADARSTAMRLLRQQHAAQQRDVFEAAADDPQGVEIVALHLDADPAELAKARLVADDAAECRRADHRAAGLGAERQRHLEIGDSRGRAARRAAGRVRGIVRMDGRPGMAVGELGRHRLAEDDARGRADQRDAGRIGKRPVAADRSASRARSACRRCR